MSDARRRLGSSALSVFPINLGGNVFGWTADETQSHRVLDAYRAGGGNFIDTADSYSAWVAGNSGGESERIIGSWLARTGGRDDLVIATKVSQHPDFRGLSAQNVRRAADASLARLGTDRIDLYYAHADDANTPIAETAAAFSELVDAGKVRYIGISNFSAERIEEWLAAAAAAGLHKPVALQPHYNLVRRDFETTLRPVAEREGLAVLPYYALASGFLTGKYRHAASDSDSVRAAGAAQYLDERGLRTLTELDEIAAAHGASVTAVALAWLAARPTVIAPIASARTLEQLPDLLAAADLELTPSELEALTDASRPTEVDEVLA